MDIASKLELHYYFDDESHSIDAQIRNKCESELLAIIFEAAVHLGIDIHIDAEALREGGIKNCWRLTSKNIAILSLFVSIISAVLSRFPPSDNEFEKLKKLDVQLSIKEKELNIAKLNKELGLGEPATETVEAVVDSVNNNFKIITRKSNLYKNFTHCHKLNKVGFSKLNDNFIIVGMESIVNRNDFIKFYLHIDELPPLIVENASIEIISPVLKEGNYKWKGIYNKEPISFTMLDNEFKFNVLTKKISFQHGTSIECVLRNYRKLDELGDIVSKGYSVETVIAKIDNSISVETSQGKRYKYNKNQIDSQGDLFNNSR
jgi:hypothetical protein